MKLWIWVASSSKYEKWRRDSDLVRSRSCIKHMNKMMGIKSGGCVAIDKVVVSLRGLGRVLLLWMSVYLLMSSSLALGEETAKAVTSVALGGDTSSGSSDTALPDLFTGTMSYQIPIEVPPGRNGMDPGLALRYNSKGGNSWVGTGWELEVGAIERSTRYGVDYSKNEYLLRRSGSVSDLVVVSPMEYRSKIESDFIKINQVKVTDRFPSRYFVAKNKMGIKFYFGETENACIYGSDGVFKWALSRIEDLNGNSIIFTYSRDNGQIYLNQIDYNGNQIIFGLEDRIDAPDMYATNILVKTAKRLKQIDVFGADGKRMSTYTLGYDQSSATGRSLLNPVIKYGKDGVTGTLSQKVSFSYSQANSSFKEPSLWLSNNGPSGPTYNAAYQLLGDFNNDGKLDYMYNYNGWYVAKSNGATFDTPNLWLGNNDGPNGDLTYNSVNANRIHAISDFNGDGKSDYFYYYRNWNMAFSNGNSFDPPTPWTQRPTLISDPTVDQWPDHRFVGDLNGDSKTDYMYYNSEDNTGWYAAISNGTEFNTPHQLWLGNTGPGGSTINTDKFFGDFNQDGKADFMYLGSNGWYVALSNGADFNTPALWLGSSGPNGPTHNTGYQFLGDFNNDGKLDLMYLGTDGWYVALNNGTTFNPPTFWLSNIGPNGEHTYNSGYMYPGDFNGDGKTDYMYKGTDGWYVALSNGITFNTPTRWLSDTGSNGDHTYNAGYMFPGDFNGDGKIDFMYKGSDGWFVALNDGVSDLLTTIQNSYGGTSTITYKPSTQYINTLLPFPVQVVSSITTNDKNGNTSITNYSYSGGYYFIAEKDFRGFHRVTVTGSVGSNGEQKAIETWFHQGNDVGVVDSNGVDTNNPNVSAGYMKGKPYRVRITGNGKTYSETETIYAADKDDVAPWFNPSAEVHTYVCDGNVIGPCKGTTNAKHYWTKYLYDSEPNASEYGNLTYEERHGDAADTNVDLTIARTYAPNVSATSLIVGLPANEKVYKGIGATGTQVGETQYYYDGGVTSCTSTSDNQIIDKGRLIKVKRWLYYEGETPSYIEERMAYDDYGNLKCRRDPKGYISSVSYDSSNTFPITTTNPLGQQYVTEYYGVNNVAADKGLYGQIKSVSDPNGAKSTQEYDALGRQKTQTLPDSSSTSWDYKLDGIIGSQRVRLDTSDGLWSENYFDGFGRTFLSRIKGPEAKTIETKTFYDARGAANKTSLPYFPGQESPQYVVMEYDTVGRVTKSRGSSADYIRTLACYNNDVTDRIDPNNHRRRELRDSGGRLISVQEYTGTSTSCISGGSTSLYATTTYQYDVLGNLTVVTDTNNNKTEIKYDSLGRKRYMRDPDMGVWRYTYDANGNLQTQTDAKGQITSFTYDELNRLKTKKHGSTLVLTNTYDEVVLGYSNKGRLTKMADLSGQAVYNYDNMGNVKLSTKTIDGKAYNMGFSFLNGRLDTITYPDKESVSYTYDAGYLKGVTGYAGYSNFDAMGRPWKTTFGTGGASSLYTFDAVTKRLSSLSVSSPTQGMLINNSDYQYYNKGNIKSITDGLNKMPSNSLSSESYTPYPGLAHVVVPSSRSSAFHPDANGNIDNDGLRTIVYNYDNMPTKVDSTYFTYDGNAMRVKKSSPDKTTIYIDKLYECTNGACTKFIFADGTRIAMKKGGQTRFYHLDHQGSTSVVTDVTGNKIDKLSYDPFGGTREGADATVSDKYTGQELDSETGLYNYNARLYDPDLGRFLTPDPIIPDPENPQSLNRYSYVLNNPLNLIDPTGNDPDDYFYEFRIDLPSYNNNNTINFTTSNSSTTFGNSYGTYAMPSNNTIGGPSYGGSTSTLTFGTASDHAAAAYAQANNGYHDAIGAGGMLFSPLNLVDSGAYALEGDYGNALMSGLYSIPGAKLLGVLGTVGKVGGSVVKSQKLLAAPKMANHHIFPKEFNKYFKSKDINIDAFTVSIPHNLTHLKGIHGRGMNNLPGKWNVRWDEFITNNKNATPKEIYQFGGRLMDEYGLSGLLIHPY